MWLSKKISNSVEVIKVFEMVIDHNIGGDNCFGATKNHLLPFNKAEMFIQPFLFFTQAIGKFHGSRNNEEFINFVQTGQYFLAIFYDGSVAEKTFGKNILPRFRERFFFTQSCYFFQCFSLAKIPFVV